MKKLKHEFVEFMPDEFENNVLYVSMRYRTATHLCCCGCGSKVVTPISPTDWKLIFYGDSVSLDPSIGNWALPCRSHYWIKRNQVKWARSWSDDEVKSEIKRDKKAKNDYYSNTDTGKDNESKPFWKKWFASLW